MTPFERARHATDAAVRAAWHARRSEPYAEDGITVERALGEAGAAPRDPAAREAATKTAHALDDARRLTGDLRPE